jgi:kinetochore protein Mis12/MTW1
VATLRSHLATLPAKNMANGVDAHTEARHGYIGSQTKRALERVGVDAVVTQDGEVGRRMGGEEARALEGIVNAMGAREEREGDKMEE